MANILIDIGHPADVHLFRFPAQTWMKAGHQVLFTALDREVIVHLLKHFQLPHQVIYKRRPGKWRLALELVQRTWATWRVASRFQPDLFVSMGNPTVGAPAWLMGKPYFALTDTEHSREQQILFKPFASLIASPDIFRGSLGPKQVRYKSYHELSYLHPDAFTPDPQQLANVGLEPGEVYFIVRFVAWGASHDVGQKGFTREQKIALLRDLASRGRVLLSVENGVIDPEFSPMVTTFPPEKVHHLLAFATLYIGEGATMASEAAVLGTPAIYVNSLTMGVQEDEQRYGLLIMLSDGTQALVRVRDLLATPNIRTIWQERRGRLLAEKINPVPWLVAVGNGLLENPHYRPDSSSGT
jgi:predicted glycosyltransferase